MVLKMFDISQGTVDRQNRLLSIKAQNEDHEGPANPENTESTFSFSMVLQGIPSKENYISHYMDISTWGC